MAGMAKRKKTVTTKPAGFTYSLPAIRAIQASQEYFTTSLPFGVLAKLIEPERSRADAIPLDRDRPAAIAEYIRKNRANFVLPALTLSIDGPYAFETTNQDATAVSAGELILAMDANIRIHDGRYRALAIAASVEATPELASETVSVVIFPVTGQSPRRLGDIKANQRKSGRSERIVSDLSDPIAIVTREVIANVAAFTDSIEMVKTTISNRSKNLFTFSALYQANELLLAKQRQRTAKQQTAHAIAFWTTVQATITEWTSAKPRVELRKETVHAHGVTLCAIAVAGAGTVERFPKTWKRRVAKLESINWLRTNTKQWEGTAMHGGRMTKSAASIELTAREISRVLEK